MARPAGLRRCLQCHGVFQMIEIPRGTRCPICDAVPLYTQDMSYEGEPRTLLDVIAIQKERAEIAPFVEVN